MYRYFLKKNSPAFREALNLAINNPDNYEYLVDYNMREMLQIAQQSREQRARRQQEEEPRQG